MDVAAILKQMANNEMVSLNCYCISQREYIYYLKIDKMDLTFSSTTEMMSGEYIKVKRSEITAKKQNIRFNSI